jgi:hypothetical protein
MPASQHAWLLLGAASYKLLPLLLRAWTGMHAQ